MSNLDKRLQTLEAKINPPGKPKYLVYLEDENGILRRHNNAGELVETMTRAEFDRLPGRKIYVHPPEEDGEDEQPK